MKINLVDKSYYTRQLELVAKLEEFLSKVDGFKAIRKLDALFYGPAVPGQVWKGDRQLGPYAYYISERYGRTEFCFYPSPKHDELTFAISEKTIPAVVEGLAARKSQLLEWIKTENEPSTEEYSISRLVDKTFEGKEFTREKLENQRALLVRQLREAAAELESMEFEVSNAT